MKKYHILASRIIFTNGKRHIVTSRVVSSVVDDMFHEVIIADGVYKVEVWGVMLPETTLFQPNLKDDPPQLLLKDMKGQFTLWQGANMWKTSFKLLDSR
jgi:hypothetical protein